MGYPGWITFGTPDPLLPPDKTHQVLKIAKIDSAREAASIPHFKKYILGKNRARLDQSYPGKNVTIILKKKIFDCNTGFSDWLIDVHRHYGLNLRVLPATPRVSGRTT